MTIEEAIKIALEFETQVRQVYYNAAEGATDPVGKRIFKVLAKEEQGHLEYLRSKLDEWKKSGTLTAERLNTVIPSRERIRKGISTLEARGSGDERGGELQMLTRVLEMEAKTCDFYKRMVKELPQEGRELFAHFVEIEEGHLAIVRAEIDYLSKTGYWFDFKEFDME